jgi:hypothetical protein
MYLCKHFFGCQLNELRYVINILPFLRDQQTKYIVAQNDVILYVVAFLGSTEITVYPPTDINLILYDKHFHELKTLLNSKSHILCSLICYQ